jgi:dethiobiotin synthetase
MRLAIIGTDTGVGKTHVTVLLAASLRALGRRVWLHKPVACGDWDGTSADDGRRLRTVVGDGQDPATVCPYEFAEPISPHLAAAAAGVQLTAEAFTAHLARVAGDHDLLVEGAGGLLAPLTHDRLSFAELLPRWQLPALIVTRPDLGTLNHTALTVRCARAAGIPLLGLIISHARPPSASPAIAYAARELSTLTGLAVLAEIPHANGMAAGMDLNPDMAHTVLAAYPCP